MLLWVARTPRYYDCEREDDMSELSKAIHQDEMRRVFRMRVLVKFEADWCQPCKQLNRWIDENASQFAMYDVKIKTVDIAKSEPADVKGVKMLPSIQDTETGVMYSGFPECRRLLEGLL